MSKITPCLKILLASLSALAMMSSAVAQQKSVAVTAIVDHPSLEAVRDGIKETLEQAGYIEGKNLRWQYQSAQGNNSVSAQIARKFVGDKPDAIVAISTPSAQTMMAATNSIPIVFSAVADPMAARLVKGWEPSGTNVTGASNWLDPKKQIEFIQRVAPDAKRVGIVYNPAEANSASIVENMQKLMPEYGLTLFTAAAPRTVDVGSAARSLADKVDVFYATTDNNVVSAIEALVRVAEESQTPLIASDPPSAARGAVAVLGVDFKKLGNQTGEIILSIFNGENPGNIPPQTQEKLQMNLNLKAAQRQGITFSEDLLKDADVILK